MLEIGTFTGYCALSMAETLPPGGRIMTCDISEEHLAIARRHIAASPYADRIEIRSGPALETIESLPGPFDLVFIDADKTGYLAYYEAILPKLAPRRRDRGRQRAVERSAARTRPRPTRTRRRSASSTTRWSPTSGSRW